MIVEFNQSFDKDLSKLDKKLIIRIFSKINKLREEDDLNKISGIKKLSGYSNFYRLRVGDYRLGFSYNKGKIVLERFLHRKEIYKNYPS